MQDPYSLRCQPQVMGACLTQLRQAAEVLGVEAVVVEGGSPTDALLGMSLLGRVSWREEQGVLVLESKTS